MNLLSSEEKEILKKGLKRRSLMLSSFLISAAFMIGLIMLFPAYFLASENIQKITSDDNFTENEDENSGKYFLNLPEEIESKLAILNSSNNTTSVSKILSEIVDNIPIGIKINSISFDRGQDYNGKTGIDITLSGISANRDALVDFSSRLKISELFSEINVPVSNLAKDKNLPFSIKIFIEQQ